MRARVVLGSIYDPKQVEGGLGARATAQLLTKQHTCLSDTLSWPCIMNVG